MGYCGWPVVVAVIYVLIVIGNGILGNYMYILFIVFLKTFRRPGNSLYLCYITSRIAFCILNEEKFILSEIICMKNIFEKNKIYLF